MQRPRQQGEQGRFAGQPSADAPVSILDRGFLPWCLRVAKPGLCAQSSLHFAPGYEFQTAIEGQAAAGGFGQGRQQADQAVHDRPRAAVVVAKQNGVTARPLDQRGEIGRSQLLSEHDQIGFPMAEFLTFPDPFGAISDRAALRERQPSGLPAEARPALAPSLGQVSGELLRPAFARIDISIDCLVTNPPGTAFEAKPPGDLLGGPAVLQSLHDRDPQCGITGELAMHMPAGIRKLLRRHRPVARSLRHLVVVPGVSSDLSVDGRTMTAEPGRDHVDA